jgi:hypothetical protein
LKAKTTRRKKPLNKQPGSRTKSLSETVDAPSTGNGIPLPSPRRFRHKQFFKDATDYLEVRDGVTYIVLRSGSRRATDLYSLATCLDAVKKGIWTEL